MFDSNFHILRIRPRRIFSKIFNYFLFECKTKTDIEDTLQFNEAQILEDMYYDYISDRITYHYRNLGKDPVDIESFQALFDSYSYDFGFYWKLPSDELIAVYKEELLEDIVFQNYFLVSFSSMLRGNAIRYTQSNIIKFLHSGLYIFIKTLIKNIS